MNKNKLKCLRMTEEDEKIINNKASLANMNFSSYVREAALDHKVTVLPGIKELHLQVLKIGNNLNQLTILCHQGVISCPNIDETRNMLSTIISQLSEISEVVYSGSSESSDR